VRHAPPVAAKTEVYRAMQQGAIDKAKFARLKASPRKRQRKLRLF
jgi:hypothetical protein